MQNEEYQDGDLENTEVETTEETTVETVEEDTTDWKAEALKYKAIADRQKKKSNPTIIKQEDQNQFVHQTFSGQTSSNFTEWDITRMK